MKILRTDGGGGNHADERLKLVRSFLNYYSINKIYLLHDHKGLLTVIWEESPTEFEKTKVSDIWEIMGECYIEHKLVNYINL
jgi:hypothetical protein